MITVQEIHKFFGSQVLFEGASLQVNAGDRYALVGANGAGKSTLMKMLLGKIEPDGGKIQFKRGVSVGYLPQENPPLTSTPVLEESLSEQPYTDGRIEAQAKAVLMGLGFKESDFNRPVNTLSGGWSMRVAMARLLMQQPNLLMLDEPTNHLDLDSLLWFQETLSRYRGAIFLISHDRSFINKVCNSIISVENYQLKRYSGNYEFFVQEKQASKDRLIQAYEAQRQEIKEMEEFVRRNRARASTASRAQSVMKRLEKLERIELPPESRTMKIKFPQPERTGVRVLSVKKMDKSYGETKVYQGLDFELERGQRMAFVGHNGAGKSTLLKILAGVIPMDSGEKTLGLNVKVGYFSQHRAEVLDLKKTVFETAIDTPRPLSEEMIRSVLGSFLFRDQTIHKKVEVLSGGEKSRLSLVNLLLDPPNVLFLDEPTTHLDLQSVEALVESLKEFEGTLCFISHDIYFINALADHVLHVEQGQVRLYPGNYEYFLRRQKQEQKSSQATLSVVSGVQKKTDIENPKKRLSKKELRQKRALQRQMQKKELSTSSLQSCDSNEKRIQELSKQLEDPVLYQDYEKVQKITEELKQLQGK